MDRVFATRARPITILEWLHCPIHLGGTLVSDMWPGIGSGTYFLTYLVTDITVCTLWMAVVAGM
jgi:hypothetical protein